MKKCWENAKKPGKVREIRQSKKVGTMNQLLSNSNHSLNKTIRSWVMRAADVVCDVVTLQKLLELFGIVAWSIVTPDNVW